MKIFDNFETIMKTHILLAALLLVSISPQIGAQTANTPASIVYNLPSTALHFEIEALKESYTPGPYCAYAKKYLGIDVPAAARNEYSLLSITLTPCIEADRSVNYVLGLSSLPSGKVADVLKVTSQGLILLCDQSQGVPANWRFPALKAQHTNASEAADNLSSVKSTLYRSVKDENGNFSKIAIEQNQLVSKNIEQRAKEAASTLLSIRAQKNAIINGETDANYSGEALSAAIEELSRQEDEYLSLFAGQWISAVQSLQCDVVPRASNEKQMLVAFRISNTDGLLLSDQMEGRPIVVEIIPDQTEPARTVEIGSKGGRTAGALIYRIPATCTVKVSDGSELLLQTRTPVYQMGQQANMPAEVLICK